MRILYLSLVLLLPACTEEPVQEPAGPALYAGQGRDRLCIEGDRAGFITYGTTNANCSTRGRLERTGDTLALIPDGDPDCRIEATLDGDRLALGARADACAYYCGPGASFAGRGFSRSDTASPAVDFAGDPLC